MQVEDVGDYSRIHTPPRDVQTAMCALYARRALKAQFVPVSRIGRCESGIPAAIRGGRVFDAGPLRDETPSARFPQAARYTDKPSKSPHVLQANHKRPMPPAGV